MSYRHLWVKDCMESGCRSKNGAQNIEKKRPTADHQSKLAQVEDERNIGSGTPRLVDWWCSGTILSRNWVRMKQERNWYALLPLIRLHIFSFQVFSGLKNSFIFAYFALLTCARCWNPTDHWRVFYPSKANVVQKFTKLATDNPGQRPNNDLLQHVVERFEEERRLCRRKNSCMATPQKTWVVGWMGGQMSYLFNQKTVVLLMEEIRLTTSDA